MRLTLMVTVAILGLSACAHKSPCPGVSEQAFKNCGGCPPSLQSLITRVSEYDIAGIHKTAVKNCIGLTAKVDAAKYFDGNGELSGCLSKNTTLDPEAKTRLLKALDEAYEREKATSDVEWQKCAYGGKTSTGG